MDPFQRVQLPDGFGMFCTELVQTPLALVHTVLVLPEPQQLLPRAHQWIPYWRQQGGPVVPPSQSITRKRRWQTWASVCWIHTLRPRNVSRILHFLLCQCTEADSVATTMPTNALNSHTNTTSWCKTRLNRRSSEIQGTALGNCLRAWTYIYIQVHACGCSAEYKAPFCWGTMSTWGKWRIPVNKKQKRHQKCRPIIHCSWGTYRSDNRFPQLIV